MIARTTTPPTTPPAIAPVCFLEDEPDLEMTEVGAGVLAVAVFMIVLAFEPTMPPSSTSGVSEEKEDS